MIVFSEHVRAVSRATRASQERDTVTAVGWGKTCEQSGCAVSETLGIFLLCICFNT